MTAVSPRLRADVSLTGNKLSTTLDVLANGRAPRLKSEAPRRDQPVPAVRVSS
jgi:hypothetical protein